MVVPPGVAVEAQAAHIGALRHEALGGQPAEVAIDGRQTHPREPAPYAPVDQRGRRVDVGCPDDVENQSAGPREPESAGAQRVGRVTFSNHYQLQKAAYTRGARVSSLRAGAFRPLPVDYPPQEDRSNGPAPRAPHPGSPAEQPQEHLA